MAKVSFTSMKLKTQEDTFKIEIAGKEIEIKKYLPIKNKNSIIEVAIQNAAGGTVLNTLLLDAYFHTYLIMEYTNINFTENQKEDILKLYDILESNNIITIVVEVLKNNSPLEYETLADALSDTADLVNEYLMSAKAISDDLLQYAPEKANEVTDIVQNFDEEKYRTLIGIAKDNGFL